MRQLERSELRHARIHQLSMRCPQLRMTLQVLHGKEQGKRRLHLKEEGAARSCGMGRRSSVQYVLPQPGHAGQLANGPVNGSGLGSSQLRPVIRPLVLFLKLGRAA